MSTGTTGCDQEQLPIHEDAARLPRQVHVADEEWYLSEPLIAVYFCTACSFCSALPAVIASGGFLFVDYPFFNVGIELSVPAVVTNPTLTAVQSAINIVAKQVIITTCEPGSLFGASTDLHNASCIPRYAALVSMIHYWSQQAHFLMCMQPDLRCSAVCTDARYVAPTHKAWAHYCSS